MESVTEDVPHVVELPELTTAHENWQKVIAAMLQGTTIETVRKKYYISDETATELFTIINTPA
jgi:hypothetical protein